jgi:hypothetical protein
MPGGVAGDAEIQSPRPYADYHITSDIECRLPDIAMQNEKWCYANKAVVGGIWYT